MKNAILIAKFVKIVKNVYSVYQVIIWIIKVNNVQRNVITVIMNFLVVNATHVNRLVHFIMAVVMVQIRITVNNVFN